MFIKAIFGLVMLMASMSMPSLALAQGYQCKSEGNLVKFESYLSTEPPFYLADLRFNGFIPEDYLLFCEDQRPESPLAQICYQEMTEGPSFYVWVYDAAEGEEAKAIVFRKSGAPMNHDAPVAELKCSAQ